MELQVWWKIKPISVIQKIWKVNLKINKLKKKEGCHYKDYHNIKAIFNLSQVKLVKIIMKIR